MSGLQHRNGNFRILFRYQGKQHSLNLGAVSQEEADSKAAQVDYLLMRLKQKLAVLPPGIDIVSFVQTDGRVIPPSDPEVTKITLAHLHAEYVKTNKKSLEANSAKTIEIHFRHFERALGTKFCISDVKLTDLQKYVDKRANANGRNGRKLSAVTIQKELVTLGTAWKWAEKSHLVTGKFPGDGLRLPKTEEKPHFQTRQEIERKIKLGGFSEAEQAAMWESLYLTSDELKKLLEYVKENATQPFVHPMFCFAAYTGARRSEMIRVRLADIDFEARSVTIREKKRVKGQITTRRVPLSDFLIDVLRTWIAAHPGGGFLFAQSGIVARSKKRSPTTGHRGPKKRGTTTSERQRTVKPRKAHGGESVTPDETHDHFQRTLAESEWSYIRGWHCLRHSFVSACATRGIDQRMIETWAGHMSPEMNKRYAHLYPSTQQQALASVFG